MELHIALDNNTGRVFVPGTQVSGVVSVSSRQTSKAMPIGKLSVQLAGVLTADPKWVKLTSIPSPSPASSNLLFTLRPHERLIFASPQFILLEDALIAPQSQSSLAFSIRLPPTLPPTFKGVSLKYSYFACVGITEKQSTTETTSTSKQAAKQQPQKQIRTVTIPIRIISPSSVIERCEWPTVIANFTGYNEQQQQQKETTANSSNLEMIQKQKEEEEIFSASFNEVAMIFERLANPICVSVADGAKQLVRIIMRRTVFRPGEIIEGCCDFSVSTLGLLCHSISIVLQAEETLDLTTCWDQRYRKPSPQSISEQNIVTSCLDVASFSLPLPHEACHEFSTPETSLRWLLYFTFFVIPEGSAIASQVPREISFSLPLHVFQTSMPNQPCIPQPAIRNINL